MDNKLTINGIKFKQKRLELGYNDIKDIIKFTFIREVEYIEDMETKEKFTMQAYDLHDICRNMNITIDKYKEYFDCDIKKQIMDSVVKERSKKIRKTDTVAPVGMGHYLSEFRINKGLSRGSILLALKLAVPYQKVINEEQLARFESNTLVPTKEQINFLCTIIGTDKNILTQLANQLSKAMDDNNYMHLISKRDRENLKIAKKIKERRIKLKLSQSAVSTIAGKNHGMFLTPERLRCLENGKTRIGAKVLTVLTKIYEMDLKGLLEDTKVYDDKFEELCDMIGLE